MTKTKTEIKLNKANKNDKSNKKCTKKGIYNKNLNTKITLKRNL